MTWQEMNLAMAGKWRCKCIQGMILIFAFGSALAANDEWRVQLSQIEHLNTIGQLSRARAMLDQLSSRTANLDPAIVFELKLLDAHNIGLSGELAAGLAAVEAALPNAESDSQRFRGLTLAANLAGAGRNHERAFWHIRDALQLKDSIQEPEYLSQFLSNASQMLANAGEFERALQLGREAVQAAQQSGAPREQCVSGQRLAQVKQLAGRDEAARDAILAALAFCRSTGNRLFSATLALQKSRLLMSQQRHDDALLYLQRATQLFLEAAYDRGLAIARLHKATLLEAAGQSLAAAELAADQLETLQAAELWEFVAEVHRLLAAGARTNGDFLLTLEHLDQRVAAEQKQLVQERARRLAYLQVTFELDAHRAEVARLKEQARQEALILQASEQRSRFRTLAYLAAVIIIFSLGLLVFRAMRERGHYRKLAGRDSLTGLHNHTRFFEAAERALRRSVNQGQPFTLVLADIDHFKQINDQFGHMVGDTVLRRVGARLHEHFSAPVICGRIGGEEFAIAMAGIGLDEAVQRLDRFRAEINRKRDGDCPADIRLSFGVAESTEGETLTVLRQRADAALYQAKREGRDRVICASQEPIGHQPA